LTVTNMFPISRDPPEGGTVYNTIAEVYEVFQSFQFLGIPPKGEHNEWACPGMLIAVKFPISRDPPEGGTWNGWPLSDCGPLPFPISRDPPEGGTIYN